MNSSKRKSLIILLATLLIGMLLGGLVVGKIAQTMVNKARDFTKAQGFVEQFVDIAKPRDAEQRQQMEAILRPHGQRIEQEYRRSRQFLVSEVNAAYRALEPILNEEQKYQLSRRGRLIRLMASNVAEQK